MKYLVFGLKGEILDVIRFYEARKKDPQAKMPLLMTVDIFLTVEKELELLPGVYPDEVLSKIKEYAMEAYRSWGKFSENGEIIVISEYIGDCAMMYKIDYIGSIAEIDVNLLDKIKSM